jgi:hypothetical protein
MKSPPANVEKKKKVTIIRLTRKNYLTERKFCLSRFLRQIKKFFVSEEEYKEIDWTRVSDIITNTFGNDKYFIAISDEKFRLLPLEKMKKLLQEDDTDQLPYIQIYADCDDFADVLLGVLTKKTWTYGFAIGTIWWFCNEFGHAQNFFIDDKENLYIIEPQNDSIMTWNDIKKQYPDAKPFLIKI